MDMAYIGGKELRRQRTIITTFMVDDSSNEKTFEELLQIFNSCFETYKPKQPHPEDVKRVLNCQRWLEEGEWNDDVLKFQIIDGIVREGIHRGVAYLRCLNAGISEEELPPIKFVSHRI